MDVLDAFRERPVSNRGELGGVHPDSIGTDNISQELYLLRVEVALFRFRVEACLAEQGEDLSDVIAMLFRS